MSIILFYPLDDFALWCVQNKLRAQKRSFGVFFS